MGELIYNLTLIAVCIVSIAFVVGMFRPHLLKGILKDKSTRKHIALYSVALLVIFIILAGITEPASVKQARLHKEEQARIARELESSKQPEPHVAEQEKTHEQPKDIEPRQLSPEEQALKDKETRRNYWHKVTAIVDGDTIIALVDGREELVRIYGINSPEFNGNECFASEAKAKAVEFLSGKWIQLEEDDSQDDRDAYGRLLRYIWFDSGTDFGRRMIEEGYAFEYTYRTPYAKQAQYKSTEEYARTKQHGLWSPNTCAGTKKSVKHSNNPAPPAPSSSKPAAPKPAVTPPPASQSCKIKGNISSKGEKIYHMPGQKFYNDTIISSSKGERWFCTEQEAINAGWRKSKV